MSNEWLDEYGLAISASGGNLSVPRLLNSSDVGDNMSLGSPNEYCYPAGPGWGVGGEPGMPGENCAPQGNVLIVQEGHPELPKSSDDGGVITFSFTPEADVVYAIGLMNVGESGATVTVVHDVEAGSERTSTIVVVGLGDNGVQDIPVNLEKVSQVSVTFAGPGAVTSISFCAAPGGGTPQPPVLTAVPSLLPSASPAPSSSPTSSCVNVTIGFDTLPDGTPLPGGLYVSNEWWDEYGLAISASGGNLSVPRLLNSSDVGDNMSLGSPNEYCYPAGPGWGVGGEPGMPGENCVPQGNVLIVQEGHPELPKSSDDGGVITFSVTPEADVVYAIGLMNVGESGATVTVVHDVEAGSERTSTIVVVGLGDNGVQDIPVNLEKVSQVSVTFAGPGAVTSISFCAAPGGGTPQPPVLTAVPSLLPSASPAPSSSPTSSCVNVTIGFDTLPDGTPLPGGLYVSNEWWDEYGLAISASGGNLSVPRLLNSSDVGDNMSLGSPNEYCYPAGPGWGVGGEPGMPGENCVPQGNVLIVQEGHPELPKSSDDGGVITFSVTPEADVVYAIGLMNVGESGATVTVVHDVEAGSERTSTIVVVGLGDNGVQDIPVNLEKVSQVSVTFAGPGAVTSISFCAAPGGGTPQPPVLTAVPSLPPSGSPQESNVPSILPSMTFPASLSPLPTVLLVHSVVPTSPPFLFFLNATIGFDTFPDGTPIEGGSYVSSEWLEEYGLTLTASVGVPRLLNTSDVETTNLGSPNERCDPPGPGVGEGGEPGMPGENCVSQGTVLIVQGSNTERPDENDGGGVITFDFSPLVPKVYNIGLMGIEGSGTTVTVVQEDEIGLETTSTIVVNGLGRNSVQTVPIDLENVSQVNVNLSGPGAVSNLSFGYVPISGATFPSPASLPSPLPKRNPTQGGTISASPGPSNTPSSQPSRGNLPSPSPSDIPDIGVLPTVSPTAFVSLVTITFGTDSSGSPLPGGMYVSDEWLEYGLTLTASVGVPRLLNTSDVETTNLGSPNERCDPPGPGVGEGGEPGMPGENCMSQGNVLIVQGSNTERPDENDGGGVITFDLSPLVPKVYNIGLMGIEGSGTTVTVVQEDEIGIETTSTIVVNGLGRNSVQTVPIDLEDVSQVNVNFAASGGVIYVSIGSGSTDGAELPAVTWLPSQPPNRSPSPSGAQPVSPGPGISSSTSLQPLPSPMRSCINVTIDFDTFPDGSPLPGGWWAENEWLDTYGLSLSASGGFLDIPRLLNTSDVENCGYGGLDRGSPNAMCNPSGPGVGGGGEPGMPGENCVPQGNVLFIMHRPDDDVPTDGVITFDFVYSQPFVYEIGLMDVDRNDTTVTVVHDNGIGIENTVISAARLGANSIQTVMLNSENVSQLKVNLAARGAVTYLSFCSSPDGSSPVSFTPMPSNLPTRGPSPGAALSQPDLLGRNAPPGSAAPPSLARSGSYGGQPTSTSRVVPSTSTSSLSANVLNEDCSAVETTFDEECNMGYYNASNLEISGSDGSTVQFDLQHSFCSPALSHIVVWFENPNQQESPDYCWDGLDLKCGSRFHAFEAKCKNGWAKVAISGGAREGASAEERYRHYIDVDEPACQRSRRIYPDFNPNKRCSWELRVPCNCERRHLSEQPHAT